LLLLTFGCPKAAPAPLAEPVDAGPLDAGPPPDAGPLVIPGARLRVWLDGGAVDAGPLPTDAGLDGGFPDADVPAPLAEPASDPGILYGPDASIPDTTTLVFEADAPLEDARFRLLTDDDRLVPNHADIWVADGGTRVALAPAPYWPPRGCCRFVVDGESERLPTGGGARYQTFEAHIGITADPNRLEAAIAAKQRQHRRHRRR
jgi:hypothetical protein